RFKLELASSPSYNHLVSGAYSCAFEIGYRMNNNLSYPTHHLVKELDIELDEEGIYSGNALKKLSRAPYRGCAFPLVRKITFLIIAEKDIKTKSWRIKTNIDAFVRRIKEIAPIADDFTVRPNDIPCDEDGASDHLDYLLSQLFLLAKRIDYCCYDSLHEPIGMQWEGISNLVHIKYSLTTQDYPFIQLVQQNASTLQSLSMASERCDCLDVLLRYTDGSNVSYPHLLTLELGVRMSYENPEHCVSEGAVPFPSLRRLQFTTLYPFGDDTPFRGNSATLEILDLIVSRFEAQTLINHRVFTPVSHPKLRRVSTRYMSAIESDMIGTAVEPIRFVLGIGPRAPVRALGIALTSAELVSRLLTSGQHRCIQDLTLMGTNLDLRRVIMLIKALPLLSNLKTCHPKLGAIPSGVTLNQLPAFLRSKYYPIGERFQFWDLGSCPPESMPDIVMCVMMLALVCPNFTHVNEVDNTRSTFSRILLNAAKSAMFKQYSKRMLLLVSHE
ncbi:hypothetical protein H4S07_002956, partial [Coemansia furcata]